MALAVSMLLLEESTIEKATRKGQISRFLLYFHGGLYYILDSCACRPAFVRESWQLHKHLKTIYSLLIQLFLYTKKLFFWCCTSFVFCHQKKRDKHSDLWALLLIWRKVIRYTKYIHNILIAKLLKY